MMSDDSDGMTYTDTDVDIEASEAAIAALVVRVDGGPGDYAGLLDIGSRYPGFATDGAGTKLLTTEALDDYSTVGVDCIAMNTSDLVATGVRPVAFVDYLAVDAPDETFIEQVEQDLVVSAEEADIELIGGETAVMPEVTSGLGPADICAGLTKKNAIFPGEAEEGDTLVGFPSSNAHSNGLMLIHKAAMVDGDYNDDWDGDDYDTVSKAPLGPARFHIYLFDDLCAVETNVTVHVIGGGWINLEHMGELRYVVNDAFDPQPVFEFV